MFHILDTVQVAVDIKVAVLNEIRNPFRLILHSRNLSRLFYRAGAIRDISAQPSDIQQGRPTCFHIDSRPNRTGVTECLTVAIHQLETTAGKEAADFIHPGIKSYRFGHGWIFDHFDRQTGKNPSRMPF